MKNVSRIVKAWLLIMMIATIMLMKMMDPLLRAHGVPKSQLKIPAEETDIEVQAELGGEIIEEPGVEVGLEVTEEQGVGVGLEE